MKAKESVQTLYMQGRYTDVASTCSKGALADSPVQCTLAACKLHQEKRARQWYGKVASAKQRTSVQSSCHDLGIDVVPPRRPSPPADKPDKPDKSDKPGPDCEANPMDCQR